MKYISFSFYKPYFYFIFYWALEVAIKLIKEKLLDNCSGDGSSGDENIRKLINEYINIVSYTIGDLIAGFLVLYSYIVSRSVIEKEEKEKINKKGKSKNAIEYIYNDLSKKKNKYTLIIIISILEFITRSTDLLFYSIFSTIDSVIRDGQIAWLISIDIISRIIFSYYLLKTKLYKHHKISLILTIIGYLLMMIIAIIILDDKEKGKWFYFLFCAGKSIILPLEDVLNKILLTNKFLLAHNLMFWRGILNFLMVLILFPILYFSKFKNVDYNPFENGLSQTILMISFITICSFFKSFIIMKVIYIFTPQHVSFLNLVFSLYELIACRISNEDNIFVLLCDIMILLLIIISTLIFNEMIIINAWGLNENTRKELLIKEKQEFRESNSSRLLSFENDEEEEDKDIKEDDIDNNNNM